MDAAQQNRTDDRKSERPSPPTRHCKKCGCELASTWKFGKCEHCRREEAEKRKKVALGAVGAIGTVTVVAVKKYGPKVIKAVGKGVKTVVKAIPK